jgi:uncharacterized SAM-binding protein YcdF (DUF218 family)
MPGSGDEGWTLLKGEVGGLNLAFILSRLRSVVQRPWFVLLLLVLFLAALYLAREPVLLAIGDFLVVEDEPLQPADLIHVLGGEITRVDYALLLYHQGYGRKLFLTGGSSEDAPLPTSFAQRACARAIAGGVNPADLLVADAGALTTYDEALALKQALDEGLAARSVILVSDPYHMRRAGWIFRRVLGDWVKVLLAPVPFSLSWYHRRWWTDPASQKMLKNEYRKLFYYWLRYSLRAWQPRPNDSAVVYHLT